MHRSFGVVAAAVLAALASSAWAKDLKVPSGAYPDITTAAAAAEDGDRILVGPGVYAEHVVLTRNRVQVVGRGAIWDGHVGAVSGTCLTVDGDDCTVSGFTFRNGSSHVVANGDGVRVLRCTSRGAASDAIVLNSSANGRVELCRILSADGAGVSVSSSDGVAVLRNTIRGCDGSGVDLDECASSVVERNTISDIEDNDAIDIDGPGADVRSNRVFGTDGRGVRVAGDDALVERNHISNTADDGIEVTGERAVIRSNNVSFGNDDSDGISYSAGGTSGATIERNVVADMLENGIAVSAGGVTVRNNQVLRCGAESDASIEISGSDNVVEGNRVVEADVDGIRISGDSNTVRNCTVAVSYEDGVVVSGDDNEFSGLRVSGCDGEGFQNEGTGTRLTNSVLTGNRIDLARTEGATWVLPLTRVTFRTGSPDTIAEVEK